MLILGLKMPIYRILGIRIFPINQSSHLKLLFNACHQVEFQKNPMNRFLEKFKCWISVQKWNICPILNILRIFFKNPQLPIWPKFWLMSLKTILEKSNEEI